MFKSVVNVMRKPVACVTAFFMIVSTVVLGTAATPADAGTPSSGQVATNWAPWTGNSGQIFTTWFGEYNNPASPKYHKVPIIDDQKIYGIVFDRGLFEYDIAPDGVTVTMTRIGERSGENLSTLAVDGSRQARISKDNLYYMWAWDGRKIFRVPEDSNTAEWIEVPAPSATYQWAGGGWSGGEVIQNTGELFLSGNEGYRLSTAANCQNTTSTEAFVMMIFNPETKNWRASGKICPQTPSDAVTHDNSNGGRVASDMALDGAGNAYILVQEGSDSTKRATLMRVVPAPASSPNIPWTYNKVKSGIPLGNQYMAWGMAFHNGKLYAGREWYDTYYDIINPLSGERQAFQGPTNLWVQDFAATQTAMVIDGKIYNDKNGNGRIDAGEEGAAGIKVAIYQLINGNYVLQGSLDTDASGSYSALLPGKGDYVVRVVQPQISGINAVQTWAKGEYLSESDGIDSTTPVCWNEGGSVGDIDFDGPCFGAKKMPAADPVLGAVGSTADPSTFAIYTTARVQSVRDVAEADFGIHAGGSFGDLGPATVATNMPYHINAGADKPPVWLGETLGSYTAAGDNASAHGTDDGVNLAMAYSADGSGTELNNQLFAAGKEYTLEAHVSGSGFNTATVQGWLASNNSATFPATPTWETNPSWVPSGTGEVREGTITFNTANHYALRVDASPSGSVITRPTNSLYEYYDSAKSGAVPWVTFGEIEDYQFRVVNSVARPALKTSGGLGSATISSPSGTDSWSRNLSVNGGPALGMPGVALSGTYTISNVPTEFTVVDIVAKDSLLGSTVGGVITAVQTTSDGATFTYTPENFSDVILEVTIAKKPDPAKSTIELLTPSGVPVGTTQVARASVVEAGNVVMPGATVTFTSDDNNLTMCPADAVDKNATTCVADTMTCTTNSLGQCSVELFSTKASTFTDKVSASIVLGGIPVNLGPAPGTKLSPIFTQSSADLKNSWFEVAPVADPSGTTMLNWQSVTTSTTSGAYTVMATIKDSYGNGVTGLTDAEVVFAASVPQVTCGNWSETGQGVYTSTCSSTLAAKDITVGVKVNSVNLTTNTTTVASDPGAVVGLPIPFKAGPVDPTPSCGNGLMGSNLSVDFDMLDVGEVSHATALVTDENCNPLADIEVSFSIDSSTVGTLDVIRNRTDATGEAFAEVTGIDAGVVNLTATVDVDGDDVDITNSPTPITFLVGDFDPATTEFTVAPCLGLTSTTVSADGVDCWVGTITAKDSTGTLITGLNAGALSGFGFPLTPAGQVMVSPIDTSKASLGKYEVTYTSTIAGSYTAEATIDGVLVTGGTGGGTIVFTAGLPAETCTDSTNSGRLGTALWTETPSVSVGDQAMISARVTDEFCNPIVGADIDFSLVAGSSATFVGPAIAETSHTGVASAVITDDVAETVGVQASLGSINFGGTTVEVTFTAGGLSATNSTFTVTQCDVSASVVVADGVECWKGTLTPKDSLGNTVSLSPAELNTFTWGAYSAGLPTDLVTISGLNNNGDITYIVTYTSTTAGDYQVAVSYGGIQVGNTETISFVAGTPSVTTPQECVAGKPGTRLYGEAGYGNVTTKTAGSSATVTALVTDENCNPVTGVEVSFASDSSTAVFSSVTATTNDQGIATVSLSDTSAGTVNVTASIPTDQMIIHGSPVVIEFTAGTPSVTTPEECVAGKPGTRIYGEAGFGNVTTKTAGSSATVTALVTDENCNPVAGVAVMFAHDSSSALLSPVTAVMTNDQGIATVSLSDASAGTVNVTASIPTDQMIVHGSPVVIEFTAGTPTVTTPQECAPGKPGTRIYGEAGYGKVTTKTAGSSATVTALVTDENCNPVTGVEVSFASDSSTAVFSSVTATTNDQGIATVSLSDTSAGTVNVTASIPTDQMIIHGSPVVIEFTAGTPTVTTPQECAPGKPGTRLYGEAGFGETTMKEAGESATVTALVTDENCNPVTGVSVSFAHNSATAWFAPNSSAVTDEYGVASVTISDTTAGIVNVTASIPTDHDIIHGSPVAITFTATSFDPAHSGFSVETCEPATEVKADGVECWKGILSPADTHSNPITTLSAAELDRFDWVVPTQVTASSVDTDGAGSYFVTYTSTVAGDHVVSLTYRGTPDALVGAHETISFTAGAKAETCTDSMNAGRPGTDIWTDTPEVSVGDSGVITARVTDEFCNPVPGAEIDFNLVPGSSATFVGNSFATTDTHGLASVSVSDNTAEFVNVAASAGLVTFSSKTAQVEFLAGAMSATNSTFVVEPCEVGPVAADGVECWKGTITPKDSLGNTVIPTTDQLNNYTWSVAANSQPTILVAISEMVSAGNGSYVVTYTSMTAGDYQVAVSYGGIQVGNTETISFVAGTPSVTTPQECAPGKPGTRLYGEAGYGKVTTKTAGSAATVTALVTDENCNPVTGVEVSFASDSSTATFSSTTAITNDQGIATVSLSDATAGTVNVTASIPTDQMIIHGSPVVIEFTAGTPSVTTPQECAPGKPGTRIYGEAGFGNVTTKTAGSSATVTALVTDENCNPVTGVEVSFASDSSTATFSSTTAITNDQGIATVSLSDATAGTVNVTASIPTDQMIIHGSPVVIEFTAGTPTVTTPQECAPGKPGTRIYGEAGYGKVTTKTAGSAATLTALVTDENCNPVTGVEVSFASDSSTAVFSSVTAITNDQGLATVSLSDTTAGTVNVTASIPTDQMIIHGSPVVIEFTAGTPTVTTPQECAPGKPGTGIYGEAGFGETTMKEAGEWATITALVTDENCNPVTGVEVSFASDSSTATFSSATATTNIQGLAIVSLHDTTAGIVNVTGTIATGTITHGSPATVEYTAAAIATTCTKPDGSPGVGTNISANPTSAEVGGSVEIIALVTDEYCNPISGASVAFATTGDATFTASTQTTGDDGYARTTLTDDTAEMVNVTAKINSSIAITEGSPAQVTFLAGSADPTKSTFTVAPCDSLAPSVVANGSDCWRGTLRVVDSKMNPLAGLDAANLALFNFSTPDAVVASSLVDRGDGTYVVTYTSTVAGSYLVSVSYNSSTPVSIGSGTITFVAGTPQVDVDENNCAPGRRGTSELVTPTTLTIDQTAEVTVYVTDAYCNPIVGETVTVHVTGSASLGATTLTTDEAGLVRTTVNDVKAETVTVSSQVAAGQIPSPTQVTFAAGELNPAMSDFIVYRSAGNADPSKVRADGIESWTGEFIPRDSGGNLVTAANPVDSAQLVVTVDSAVSVTSGTAGTYTWLFTSLTYDTAFVVELSLDGARVGTTQTITFTDADAPEPPVITHPVTGSWFNTTPDIAGTDGEPGSTITVTDAKGEVLCTSIASADESWSCAPNRTLSEGRYMITATATDSEGNVSEPSAPVSFTIKTTPPTKPVVDSSNGSKVTGQGEPGSSVSVVDEDGNPVPGCSDVEVDSTGRFECVPETPLTPGQSITVTVTDPAGNTSPPVTIEIVPLMAVATHPLRYRGEVQVVSGYNFNPGESVSLTVYSDPFAAGTAVVNADGTVTITFIIPDDMEYGFHTAILTGVESGSAYVTFEVIAKPAAPVAPEIPYVPTGGVVQGGSWLAIYLLIAGSLVSFVGFLMVRIRRNSDAK